MVANASIHAFLEFLTPVLCIIFFPGPWLVSHMTIVERLASSERHESCCNETKQKSSKRNWLGQLSNAFPNKLWFLRVYRMSLLKTLWEKEELLVTNNFSFSQCFLPIWITTCYFHQI